MPYAAPHPCPAPGCAVLLSGPGRCPAHQKAAWQAGDEHRGSARQRGYDTAWDRLRAQVRAEEPWCRMCEAEGRLTLAEMVDHIVPIAVRPDLRLARSNLQSLCGCCHAIKSAEDERKYGGSSQAGTSGEDSGHLFATSRKRSVAAAEREGNW